MGGAILSPDRLYRYQLWRETGNADGGICNFVGLNPSTADEGADDPTVRRCVAFAARWGYGRMLLTNLFAFRATNPGQLWAHTIDTVGADNDAHLEQAARISSRVVICWGANAGHRYLRGRAQRVQHLLLATAGELWALKVTQGGHPQHPLYLAHSTQLVPWAKTDLFRL